MAYRRHFHHHLLSTILLVVSCLIPPLPLYAASRLPHVTRAMEKPEYWLKKIKNPAQLLLTSEQINRMNEELLKRQDLYLCNLKELKEEWTQEELLALLEEDLKGFGRTEEVRYGGSGLPLGDDFWNPMQENLNRDSIQKENRIHFGLIVNRTNIRVFPTDEISLSDPKNEGFDRFQHSALTPGSPVAIYLFGKDKEWAYIQTYFIRGWIHVQDVAVAREKSIVIGYGEPGNRLVITGNYVKVFAQPSLQEPLFLAQMGDGFPLLALPGKNTPYYVIQIPVRDPKGLLLLEKGYIKAKEDVHQGFLPYTQRNIAYQAFKMLHHPYGWGDREYGRDCSRFLMDIFRTFGILLPRNSKFQALSGAASDSVEGMSVRDKKRILDQAVPLTTLIRMPGHIMLYLGRENGRYYVIHSFWGFHNSKNPKAKMVIIGKTAVSDLSLGETGPYGSFLDRMTHVRTIGSESGQQKEKQ